MSTTAEQRLFDWVSGLMARLPHVRVDGADRPGPGPVFDFRHAVAAYSELAPEIATVATQGAWQAVGAWIYDDCAAARAGMDLSADLGAALGVHEPDDEETAPLRRAPRALWHPGPQDVEADRVDHRREVMAALEMLRALMGEDEWAKRRDLIPEVIRDDDGYAPLVLSGDDEPPPDHDGDDESAPSLPPGFSEETLHAAYARYEAMLEARSQARDNVIELSAVAAVAAVAAASEHEPDGEVREPEPPRWMRRDVQWVAGAVATAVAAVAIVVFSAHPPPASVQACPLPLSAADYPTCPAVTPAVAPAVDVAEPAHVQPVASPAAAPPPPPPPRRKVSQVKLTEIGGVRVRKAGHADVVISARKATQADEQLYVIDLDVEPDTAVTLPMRPDADVWMVLE